jgi:hypothetical protein
LNAALGVIHEAAAMINVAMTEKEARLLEWADDASKATQPPYDEWFGERGADDQKFLRKRGMAPADVEARATRGTPNGAKQHAPLKPKPPKPTAPIAEPVKHTAARKQVSEPVLLHRTAPHNIEAEQALLGAILMNNGAYGRVSNFLEPRHFFEPAHQRVYEIAATLIGQGRIANPVTLKTFLPGDVKIGQLTPSQYLARLAAEATTVLNAEDYGRTIWDLAVRRSLIVIGEDLVDVAFDAPVDFSPRSQIEDAERRLYELAKIRHDGAQAKPIEAIPYSRPDPAAIPQRQFLYGKHYLRGEVSTTIAAGGKAKTTLKLTEAIGMAVGRNLMTTTALNGGPLRVWVVNAEEDKDELDRRIAAICQHYKVEPHEHGDRLFVTSLKGQPQWSIATIVGNAPTINRPVVDKLTTEIQTKAIDVLMLDPLVSFHAVKESDNGHMDAVIKEGLGAIAHETRASIGIAHHTGKPKPGQSDASVDDSRGASAIIWAARLNRVLNGMSTVEAKALGISTDDRRLYVRINGGAKANPAPPEKATWVKIEPINLPNGDEVAVVIPWAPPDPFAAAAGDVAYKVRELVKTGEYRADSRSPQWIGFAVADLLGVPLAYGADNKPEHIATAKRAVKMWLSSKTLAIQRRKDENSRERTFVVLGPWEKQSGTAPAALQELADLDFE